MFRSSVNRKICIKEQQKRKRRLERINARTAAAMCSGVSIIVLMLLGSGFSVVANGFRKCEINASYSCLVNEAAVLMERASNLDVSLFDGIIFKKNNETFEISRGFSGLSRLRHALVNFLDSHVLTLDLTESRQSRVGGGGGFKISKKEKKYFWYTMMVLLGIFGLTGPLVMKMLTLIAGKALIASKIALLMVGSVALKKIFTNDNKESGGGVKVYTHTIPIHSDDHDRQLDVDSYTFTSRAF